MNKGKTFKLYFEKAYFNKKDILTGPNGIELIVTKVTINWWKRFLLWLGFTVSIFEGIEVKENDKS